MCVLLFFVCVSARSVINGPFVVVILVESKAERANLWLYGVYSMRDGHTHARSLICGDDNG